MCNHPFPQAKYLAKNFAMVEQAFEHLEPVYMEASYPVDRVTRFAGTNKRSVYMEPSYSALIQYVQYTVVT